MATKTFFLLSTVLVSIAIAAGMAHLFALPNKIDVARELARASTSSP